MYFINQQKLYSILSLIDDPQLYPILLKQIWEKYGEDMYGLELALEEYKVANPKMNYIVNQLIIDLKLSQYLESLTSKIVGNEIALSQWIFDLNAMMLGTESNIDELKKWLDDMVNRLKNTIDWKSSPLEIFQTLNHSIAEYFIIEPTESESTLDFIQISQTQKICNYALGVLYLMVSQKLTLPIFAIPRADELLLMMCNSHCIDSELVYESDVLFYFTPGPHGIVYTLQELEMLARENDRTLSIFEKLPKSNKAIVFDWLKKLDSTNLLAQKDQSKRERAQRIFSMLKKY